MKLLFEQMGGSYTLGEDGLYYPNLVLSEEEKAHYGKYGMLCKTYLKEHRKGFYSSLMMEGKLVTYLNEVDVTANARMELLIRQMQEKQGIDEKFKSQNQMKWVGLMNNIKASAEEIVLKDKEDDDKVLRFVRSRVPDPAINVCYMITSEQCNLACKYCFLGNNDACKRSNFSLENMSIETADKAVDFFINQIKLSGMDFEENKPVIIFYGGEPLVNYDVLVHIAEKINGLRDVEKCVKNLEMSMVSNGLLLTEERALKLKELGVSIAISVDGFTEEANAMRVDVAGNNVFNKILKTLDMCKRIGVEVSLSVTLSEETIRDTKNILKLVDNYDIKSFGFNIMMSDENFVLPQEYNEKAAQFIIDEFVELRKRGIYEDRIMRKLKSFSKSQVYFSDCAATSGGQIVIAPNGQVGICHGCLHNKQYFVSNVDDADFNASKHKDFIEWSQLTPINKGECQDCPALGICGGGCPINAMHLKKGNTIYDLDERFCIHSKMTLEFLIRDLYRIIKEG